MDLTCVKPHLMQGLVAAFYAGFALSAALIPILADYIGRKKPLLMCMFI